MQPTPPSNTRRRVYFNLHKKLLSVQAKVNGQWKVINHVNRIDLCDVRFKVSEAGRQRVLRENRKNVHAFVEGDVIAFCGYANATRVAYNPYKYEKFTTGEKYVDKADFAIIVGREIGAINPQ
jgi:hypothetical protein